MIIWRMKQLGYSEETFSEKEKEIDQTDNYSRHYNSTRIERYGKKYSWIAYFELYGHFILKKLIEPENKEGCRISSVDIDPTFPGKPLKRQLVIDCFTPEHDDEIQKWINK